MQSASLRAPVPLVTGFSAGHIMGFPLTQYQLALQGTQRPAPTATEAEIAAIIKIDRPSASLHCAKFKNLFFGLKKEKLIR